MKEYNYIHYDAQFGTINCYGDGAIRDMFEKGMETMNLPRSVDIALERVLHAIYEQTGEMPTINIF
ncbi:MAG: hypothetical protein DRH97_00815 [Chloroflexi bacterium]|nr:MAG: hypothetical protein DRH97_00815 [Chloroflexota bacterium]